MNAACKACRALRRRRQLSTARRYERRQWRVNPAFRLSRLLRNRINKSIDGQVRPGSAVRDLGCTPDELRAHLEAQFYPRSDGLMMAWNQRGLWHIHHIKPLASFDLSDPEQFKEACHYANLQPLWVEDHIDITHHTDKPKTDQ